MSQDFFRIERGLELDDTVQYLQGAGAPGSSVDTDGANVGSVYTDNLTGALYTKISSGTGADKWQAMASEQYVNNAVGATISWREPAYVRDNTTTTLPTAAPSATIVIDGQAISDGMRVLFAGLTGGDGKNIYVYNQATGTFVEDVNQESTGDAAYVQAGTSAGKTFIYNGTAWVQSDQASMDEIGYLQAFIGKSASGNEMPSYTSTNFVAAASALDTAISALDAEVGINVSLGNYVDPTFKVNGNIQALDTALGANVTDGNHITAANKINANIAALDTQVGAELLVGNFIAANDALSTAITALDNEFGPNVATGNFVTSANKVNQNLQALDTEIGAQVTSTGVILDTNSVNQNVQALAVELAEISTEVSITNVTSIQTIDSVTAGSAKWLVRVELVSDTTRVYSTEVYALGNGVSSDFTRYATLKIGTAIPGLSVTVDNVGGSLRLRVASTGAVNVASRRVGTVA